MVEYIERIFYINLDSRKDREKELLAECARMKIPTSKLERFSAVAVAAPLGWIGCTMSHLKVAQLAKERGYKNYLVLEDDVNFHACVKTFHENLTTFFREQGTQPFKVCMLAANLIRTEPIKKRTNCIIEYAREAQSGAAYIVHHSCYDLLIACYERGLDAALSTCMPRHWLHINDQTWKPLQLSGAWYAFKPLLAYQRPSYSDLAGKVVDYKGHA